MTATIDLTIQPIAPCRGSWLDENLPEKPEATDGDPVCPMTGTNSCAGADATQCTAC